MLLGHRPLFPSVGKGTLGGTTNFRWQRFQSSTDFWNALVDGPTTWYTPEVTTTCRVSRFWNQHKSISRTGVCDAWKILALLDNQMTYSLPILLEESTGASIRPWWFMAFFTTSNVTSLHSSSCWIRDNSGPWPGTPRSALFLFTSCLLIIFWKKFTICWATSFFSL